LAGRAVIDETSRNSIERRAVTIMFRPEQAIVTVVTARAAAGCHHSAGLGEGAALMLRQPGEYGSANDQGNGG